MLIWGKLSQAARIKNAAKGLVLYGEINFTGDISEVEEGISILKEELNFEVCGDRLTVNVKRKAAVILGAF